MKCDAAHSLTADDNWLGLSRGCHVRMSHVIGMCGVSGCHGGNRPVVLLVVPVVLVARVPARAPARIGPSRAPLAHISCAIPQRIDRRRSGLGRPLFFITWTPQNQNHTAQCHCHATMIFQKTVLGPQRSPARCLETTAVERSSRGLSARKRDNVTDESHGATSDGSI